MLFNLRPGRLSVRACQQLARFRGDWDVLVESAPV